MEQPDNDNNILQELEKADKYNAKIECEMNNILKESDSALINAESQLNEIIDNDTFVNLEKDIEVSSEGSFALSIEVSRDLFKEFDNEHNISAIYPSSVDVEIPSTTVSCDLFKKFDNENNISAIYPSSVDVEIPSTTVTKLPEDVIEEPKSSEELNEEEEGDTTIKNEEILGSSLEITITNDEDVKDNENDKLETTLLNNSPTFKGCSEEFASNGVEKKITVVVDVEKGRSVEKNNKPEINTKILQEKSYNIDVNSNQSTINIPPVPQRLKLKRPNDENYPSDVTKKLKYEDLTPKTIETKTPQDVDFDNTQTEYSQVIFDPDETADANDPKWSEFNNNFTSIEEHFGPVRQQWRSMALPNPHRNLTMRFIPQQLQLNAPTLTPNTNNEYSSMSCVNYLDNKINRYTQKVNSLYVRMNYLPQSNRGRYERNKILREIDELQKFVIEIVKNREEIQQNFKCYQHPNNIWNANYLTRSELDKLKEQEKLLEFQKKFYSTSR